MTAELEDVKAAEENLLRAALRELMAERGLADENGSVKAVTDTSSGLRLAARDLFWAVNALPRESRPKGWTA